MRNTKTVARAASRRLAQRAVNVLVLTLLLPTMVFAQTKTVTGTVYSEQGEAVVGATVQVKGTRTATMTDANGGFTIGAEPQNVLKISSLGYADKEVTVGNQSRITITLQSNETALDEVITVGYGVQKKSDVTGAITSVSAKALQEHPVPNMLEALQGKAAGVDITNNARPGELGSIRIRGERSITGGNDPLYVVNGIPLLGRDNINMLNTADIKSIEVLKDASATAIYGSRGANGVILISTYDGEQGNFEVKYNGSMTITNLVDSRERFTASEFIDFQRWAYYYANPGTYPRADEPTLLTDQAIFGADPYAWANVQKGWASGTWDGSKVETTDWTKFVTQQGYTQNHTISMSGGTERLKNYISIGYLDTKGTSQGQNYKRYTLNTNSTLKPTDWFEAGARINGAWQTQEYGQDGTGAASNSGAGSIYESALKLYPYAVPYDENGERILFPGGQASLKTVVDETSYSHNQRQTLSVFANVYAHIQLPLKGLSFRSEFGPSFRYRRNGIFVDPNSAIRENSESLVRLSEQRDFVWTVNNMLYYNNTFADHNIGVTLLQTSSKDEETGSYIYGKNVPVPTALWNNLDGVDRANDITAVGSDLEEEQLASYMLRLNYAFKERYLLTASGRWDGSSVLAEGHKWAFFPSVSLGWRIDQEEFLKGIEPVNQLKLRIGYGVVGNAAVGPYSTLGSISSALYPYGSDLERFYFINDLMATSTRNTLPNKELGWEKTAQFNIGLDFSILKNRISGSIEWYNTKTTDLLLSSTVPSLTGYVTTIANTGSTKNHGIELTFNTLNVKTRDFTWGTDLSVSWQEDEIVELSNGKEDEIVDARFIGYPLGVYYNYKADGLWREEDADEMAKFNSATAPDGTPKTAHNFQVGQTKVVDQNGDYVIDANNDRVIIGQQRPSWVLGMNNTFNYKGIELTVMIYGRLGYWTDGGSVVEGGKYMLRKVDYYNENNKNAAYQRPQYTSDGSDYDTYSGALAYSKASFINIRTISLGYNFSRKLIKNWGGMKSLKCYVQAQNPGALYQSVDYKNMDLNSSIWNRNFVFGLNVGF